MNAERLFDDLMRQKGCYDEWRAALDALGVLEGKLDSLGRGGEVPEPYAAILEKVWDAQDILIQVESPEQVAPVVFPDD
jgi:hypothetical protein